VLFFWTFVSSVFEKEHKRFPLIVFFPFYLCLPPTDPACSSPFPKHLPPPSSLFQTTSIFVFFPFPLFSNCCESLSG
jgi:hypothetical protein